MKKFVYGLLAIVLIASLFFTGAPRTVLADDTEIGYTDTTPPFTTDGSYDCIAASDFTEGTSEVNGQYFPKGYETGALQYHYEVVHVRDMGSKLTTIKFIFKQWYFGWEGAIYQWNGTKWVKVPTKMEMGFEDGGTFATAQVSDGYYALLVWYSGVERAR
jgi:hypothetical protein